MSDDKSELDKAADELNEHIDSLANSVNWACDELARLRADNWNLSKENLELQLKIKNLTYMLRSLTGRLN